MKVSFLLMSTFVLVIVAKTRVEIMIDLNKSYKIFDGQATILNFLGR